MKLLFERSRPGRGMEYLPPCNTPAVEFVPDQLRAAPPRLPELSEVDLDRHYTELARQTHGVNDGFYPLGSCTMKYNPRVNEALAALPGFAGLHPLQSAGTVQGALEVLYRTEKLLSEITGMTGMTMQPAAGAHGEYTGLLLIRRYHQSRGDAARTKILVPDSAHGTNPASASMAGFTVVSVPSNAEGGVDLDALRAAVGPDTAGLMLTNPNTLGLFDPNILEITRIIHKAGGLCYYDGANLNAVMGHARPGDMGFDCVHLNLHKTFSTPHGGGGPGSGPVGCKAFLEPFLPAPRVRCEDGVYSFFTPEHSLGRVRSFYGNFAVVVRALAYLLALGKEGIPEAAENAVLNANYLMHKLAGIYDMACGGTHCMHEFVMDLSRLKAETGVTAMDVAKRLLDFGIHPPTMYFPLIVHEALMVEPTETESPETLDAAAELFLQIWDEAHTSPETLHTAPHNTPIGRPDEVTAARKPVVRYAFESRESAMKQLSLIETSCTDPYRNLALEKYLMDHVQPGQCILYLWQNANTVVIGRNQCAADECRLPELEAAGGHLARRLSGGGAVYHDLGNLNFTFLARRADYNVARQTEVILQAVRALGVPAQRNGRNDLTAEEQKFSGHAYYRSGDACYHHGTLMVSVALDQLGRYLKPAPDKLKAKGVQSVRARVVNLNRYCPGLTIPQLRRSLADAFGQVYGLPVQPLPDGFADETEVAALTEKFSAPGWLYGGEAPAGQAVRRARYGWGGVTLRYTLERGKLRQVTLASDGLEADYLAEVPARLEGCTATSAAVESALMGDIAPGLHALAADLAGLLFAPLKKEDNHAL